MAAIMVGETISWSVQFSEAGTYWIDVRGKGEGHLESSDSVAMLFNGAALPADLGWSLGYSWSPVQGPMKITVKEPGTYQLSAKVMEVDFVLDSVSIEALATTRHGDGQAQRAADFIDTLGLNVHLGYFDTPYHDVELVSTELAYLGVHNVRDDITGDWQLANMDTLIARGVKFVMQVGGTDDHGPQWLLDRLEPRAQGILAVEGPNESDNAGSTATYKGLQGLAATRAIQTDLYQLAHASGALNDGGHSTLVVAPSLAYGSHDIIGDLSAFADAANQHVYYQYGNQPSLGLIESMRQIQHSGGTGLVMTTETGYSAINASRPEGVSEAVQGKYTPRAVLENFVAGVDYTFLYQLMDLGPTDGSANPEKYYGLFLFDGTPRPAAVQLHNLTTVLSDKGADASRFAPGSLDYVVHGMPKNAEDLLLQRSDGTFLLALWNDSKSWAADKYTWDDPTIRHDLVIPAVPITIDLPGGYVAVALHDTVTGKSLPLADPLHPAFDLFDSVSVLEVARRPLQPTLGISRTGSSGNDAITGGAGADSLSGADGADTLNGLDGNDRINGNRGNDVVSGGSGDDELFGEAGNDVLFGSFGNDLLNGSTGNDRLVGGAGDDTMTGGSGSDLFVLTRGDGHDTITDFRIGRDKIRFEGIGASDVKQSAKVHDGVSGVLLTYSTDDVFVSGVKALAATDLVFA